MTDPLHDTELTGTISTPRDQCAEAGVALFMKQMARKAAIPADLMVRQMPN